MYQVQIKEGPRAKWRVPMFSPRGYATLEAATAAARALDQDGCIPVGQVRIVSPAGAVVPPADYAALALAPYL